MIVEVAGAGFHNMGAELMLVAARNELRTWDTVEDVAIGFRTGTTAKRERTDVGTIVRVDNPGRPLVRRGVALGVKLAPRSLLGSGRTYQPSDIGALLDASGFAFGDQWGPDAATQKERLFRSYRKRSTPIVLLPQAFGPFERPDVADAARSALQHADLIYARDPESLAHLEGLGLDSPMIGAGPDFTNLVEPTPVKVSTWTVILIPNGRMTEMVTGVTGSSYLAFLHACAATSLEAGYEVIAMAHEAMDLEFASRLQAEFPDSVRIHTTRSAVGTKAIVGGASLVISSRYHGLVNALSQSIPAVGTSWSHKYQYLLADYACEDALWEVDADVASERLTRWLDREALKVRHHLLQDRAAEIKNEARRMWADVRAIVSP